LDAQPGGGVLERILQTNASSQQKHPFGIVNPIVVLHHVDVQYERKQQLILFKEQNITLDLD